MNVCKGICKGTDRSAVETPAKLVKLGPGKSVLMCECCHGSLRLATHMEGQGQAPNIPVELRKTSKRFVDDTCIYDIVLLKEF